MEGAIVVIDNGSHKEVSPARTFGLVELMNERKVPIRYRRTEDVNLEMDCGYRL